MSRQRLVTVPLAALLLSAIVMASPRTVLSQTQVCDPSQPKEQVNAQELVEKLRSQRPVLLSGVRVAGDLDLSGLGKIAGPLVLTNSTVEGRLVAPFSIFSGTVDFTNSCFSSVDLHGSIFEGDVTWSKTQFGADYDSLTDIRGARFRGSSDIRGAQFNGPAKFQNVTFEGRVFFQQAQFYQEVEFDRVSFQERVSFIHSIFRELASFHEVSVSKDADFTGAQFFAEVIFSWLTVDGNMSLRNGVFEGKVILDRASVAHLQLLDNRFTQGVKLSMSNVTADSLEMDLIDVERVDDNGEKLHVLELLEGTARKSGDATVANAASFRRQVLENESSSEPWQTLRRIFFQGVGGYLVRPLHPLFTVLGVVVLGGVVRLIDRRRRVLASGGTLWNASKMSAAGFSAFAASTGAALRVKPEIPDPTDDWRFRTGVQLIEWLIQKILIACFMIAIVNTSPVAKDIISSIFTL